MKQRRSLGFENCSNKRAERSVADLLEWEDAGPTNRLHDFSFALLSRHGPERAADATATVGMTQADGVYSGKGPP